MSEEKHSIDKMIEENEENDEFNEMTAQLAGKIIMNLDIDDDESENYENIKDMIRDHVISWHEHGDTSNMENENED